MKVAIAGDWHGNAYWAEITVPKIAAQLEDQPFRVIYHLGDFGYWPGKFGKGYRVRLEKILAENDAELQFLDGNHENHKLLIKQAENDCNMLVTISDHIYWMRRGYRFTLDGKVWLIMGGAASVDKSYREENVSWFPEELITDEQRDYAIAGGHADVMLTHDRPSKAPITFPHSNWPDKDLAISQAHMEKLQDIVDHVKPAFLMHGHEHMALEDVYDFGYGPVRVNGFNCDGCPGNWGILDTETMEWVYGE
jgi:hypothetical protein